MKLNAFLIVALFDNSYADRASYDRLDNFIKFGPNRPNVASTKQQMMEFFIKNFDLFDQRERPSWIKQLMGKSRKCNKQCRSLKLRVFKKRFN